MFEGGQKKANVLKKCQNQVSKELTYSAVLTLTSGENLSHLFCLFSSQWHPQQQGQIQQAQWAAGSTKPQKHHLEEQGGTVAK